MSNLVEHELQGKILYPLSEAYNEYRQIFNAAIDTKPAAIVLCETTEDVSHAVKLANTNDWTIAIKGGGHHLSGFAVAEGSLVIDTSNMKAITVNEAQKTVTVQAGVKAGEVNEATQAYGLAVPLGTASATGIMGVALGGGIGYLRGVHGLTCDNIMEATVVTAQGDILYATETTHADLLWALRGGGGNFGVVTELTLQAHEVGPNVLAFDVLYDYADAKEVFTKLQAFTNEAPDEAVAVNALVVVLPPDPNLPEFLHFKQVIMVMGLYAGNPQEGESIIQPLRELATTIVDQTAVIPFLQLQRKLDATIPPRVNCYGTSVFIGELTEDKIDVCLQQLNAPPTPAILGQIWSLGGKMNKISPEHAAFGVRDAKWAMMFDAMALNGDDDVCKAWIQQLYDALLPISHKRATYLNGIGPSEKAVEHAFGTQLRRLQQVKQQYDRTNVFIHNHTIVVK